MSRTTHLALASVFALAACGGQTAQMPFAAAAPRAPSESVAADLAPTGMAPSPASAAAAKAPPPAPPGQGPSGVPAASVRAPLVTYVGEMGLRVDRDPAGAIDGVIAAAEAVGGYLSARRDAGVEVRVPSARFREAMAKIEPLGEVTHRSVSATDVSDEFHDAEVRLQNLRATRARLEGLLSHAGSLADTLAVEHELERVALEIDRLEGRLEYLKARVAYSSISVAVEARRVAPPTISTGPAPKRFVDLPVAWLGELGVDRLLTFR
jgi:hypothetical protein